MTIIVGISNDTHVYIGGDRGVSDDNVILSMSRPKIAEQDGWLFGYAGTLGTGQLLEFIEFPKMLKTSDPYKVLRLDIVEQLKKMYDHFGRDIEDNGTDWLIGYQNRLFEMSSGDWGVLEVKESAIGTGNNFALGSLYTSRNWRDTKKRVHKAIESSIHYSPTCLDPIDIYNT